MKKLFLLLLVLGFSIPLTSRAATLSNNYPRLANYFLKWNISESEVPKLAKWNVLVLDMEVQENSPQQLLEIRKLNPHIIILAYITSEEILDDINDYNNAYLRQELAQGIASDWWLKDASGHKVSNWPNTSMLNLSDGAGLNAQGERFNNYLPEFVVNKLESSGLWDGVFYDNTWGQISWIKNKNLDLNNDGQVDGAKLANQLWSTGFKKMLAETRTLAGPNFIIVGNGQVYNAYQHLLNGMMLEDFPSPWENGGTWTGSMETYLKLPSLNRSPKLSIINIYDKNQEDYQRVRFGLASTLLGDGFFSYDYDVSSPGQTWWYDEYSIKLGPPQSAPYDLIGNSKTKIQPGLWRRDFKNGIVVVNSTNKKQVYVFPHEEFEKIKGHQDPDFNNGKKINYLILKAKDGIVLLKTTNLIENSPFVNGYFYRIYNSQGQQKRHGFFSYLQAYPGESKISVLNTDNSNNKSDLVLVADQGRVTIYKNGQKFKTLAPYGQLYHGTLNIGLNSKNGDFSGLVTGAGFGGGPQVSVFNQAQKLQSRFFAYNKNLRGGVSIAIGDLNGDGQTEIITAPGPGTKPIIKVFSLSGHLENSFLAYNSNFRGGVNVAIGDLNGDGQSEIITSPASHGGPQIRIFNSRGRVLGSFFAYNKNFRGGIQLSVSDINSDGRAEILAGLKNFY